MRRLLKMGLGALALSLLGNPVHAQDAAQPVAQDASQPAVILQDGNDGSDEGSHLMGGLGMYVLRPHLESSRAFTSFIVSPAGANTTRATDFSYDTKAAPRVWLGLEIASGWGVRTSYWHFQDSADQTAAFDGALAGNGSALSSASPSGFGISTGTFLLGPGNFDILSSNTSLRLNVWDLEATKNTQIGNCSLLISGGARIARITETYNVDVTNSSNDPANNAQITSLRSNQTFSGAGPTLALEAVCPVGESNFSIYGMGRAAFLFGHYRQSATSATTIIVGGAAPVVNPTNDSSIVHDLTVPFGELEFGAQWSSNMGSFRPMLRAGITGQSWGNVLNNNNSNNAVGDPTSHNGNLSFIGFTLTAGVSY